MERKSRFVLLTTSKHSFEWNRKKKLLRIGEGALRMTFDHNETVQLLGFLHSLADELLDVPGEDPPAE